MYACLYKCLGTPLGSMPRVEFLGYRLCTFFILVDTDKHLWSSCTIYILVLALDECAYSSEPWPTIATTK